jgi:hypothetical protein
MPDVHQAEEDLVNKEQVRAFVAQLELRKHLDTVYTELDRQGYQESEYDYLHTVIRFIDRYIEVDTAGIDSALSNLQDTITKLNRRLWDIYRTHQPKETSSKSHCSPLPDDDFGSRGGDIRKGRKICEALHYSLGTECHGLQLYQR